MTYYNRETQVINRINAINNVYSFVNAIMPELLAFKKANGLRVRKDNTLFRKDKEALDNIIAKHKNHTEVVGDELVTPYENIRYFYRIYEYSQTFTIEFSLDYRISPECVNYFKYTATLNDILPSEYGPLKLLDLKEMLEKFRGYDELAEKARTLQYEVRSLENTLFGR